MKTIIYINKERRLRSTRDTLDFIKSIDQESAVTRYMITSLIKENKIYNQKVGNKAIIDLDEVLQVLGLLYE